MPRSRPPCAPEYRRQMIELVRAGRTPEDLAREFEPSASMGRGGAEWCRFGQNRIRRRGNTQTVGRAAGPRRAWAMIRFAGAFPALGTPVVLADISNVGGLVPAVVTIEWPYAALRTAVSRSQRIGGPLRRGRRCGDGPASLD